MAEDYDFGLVNANEYLSQRQTQRTDGLRAENERLQSENRALREAGERVYQLRHELYNDPNKIHRAITRLGWKLKEIAGQLPAGQPSGCSEVEK